MEHRRHTDTRWNLLLGGAVTVALILVFYGLGMQSTPALSIYRLLGAVTIVLLAFRRTPADVPDGRSRAIVALGFAVLLVSALSFLASLNRGVTLLALADVAVAIALFAVAASLYRQTAAALVGLQVVLLLPIGTSAILEPLGLRLMADYGFFPGRAVVNMGGPGPLGALLVMLLPTAAALWLRDLPRWSARLGLVSFIVILTGITATFSRAAMAAGIIGSAAAALLVWRSRRHDGDRPTASRIRRNGLVLLIVIVAILPAYNRVGRLAAPREYRVGDAPGTQTFQTVRQIKGTDITNAEVRVLCWQTALGMIADRPWTGVGVGCFGIAGELYSPSDLRFLGAHLDVTYRYAYNDFLQLTAERGVLALLLFVVLVAWVLHRGLQGLKPRADPDQPGTMELLALIGVTGGLVAAVSQGLVDFPLHLPSHSTLFWIDLGLVVALAARREPRTGTLPRSLVIGSRALSICLAGGILLAATVPWLAERASVRAAESFRRHDTQASVSHALRATRLAGYEHEYWVQLAETSHALYLQDPADTAALSLSLDAYREAIGTRPHHAPTWGRAGALYLSHVDAVPGAADSARVYLERATALNPYYADTHTNLGTVLSMHEETGRAREEFLVAARLDTTSADPLFNLGNLEAGQGRTEAAVRSYRRALEREPDHFPTLANLALALIEQDRAEEALPLVARAERAAPNSPQAEAVLGTLRRALAEAGAAP